ncbi:MAG: alanine:cation symporter family protein [Lachnospiraceae bacterium]|nr:alanine:cation symporter family protein [Lachnospiraceae bacterium]
MNMQFATKAPKIVSHFFAFINNTLHIFKTISDFLWTFPTNIASYNSIPIIGKFSLFIILITITAIYLTVRFGFVQLKYFKKSLDIYHRGMNNGNRHYYSAFILSTAARVGSTNIIGVTSAIAIGGPGALFWIWVCGFFAMGVAFVEGTLTQIFKGKKEKIFYGGLPFYGQKMWGNNKMIGAILAIAYIMFALCSIPLHGYTAVSAMGESASILLNKPLPFQAYNFLCIALVLMTGLIVFGSIHRVKRACKIIVPIMLFLYILVFLFLAAFNFDKIPTFFYSVFTGAFNPKAFVGGSLGATISIGVKTAINSNEACMGTVTFADATSRCSRPVRQGLMASLNVFLDTMIICTITGFFVIAASCYTNPELSQAFNQASDIQKFTMSIDALSLPFFFFYIKWIIYLCMALFSFSTLICQISFCDLAIMKVTRSKSIRYTICIVGLFITLFGVVCSLMGLSLDNLWSMSNLAIVIITLLNIPLIIKGSHYVALAFKHFKAYENASFTSASIGSNIPFKYWDKKEELDDND